MFPTATLANISDLEQENGAIAIKALGDEKLTSVLLDTRLNEMSDRFSSVGALVTFYISPSFLDAVSLIPDDFSRGHNLGPAISLISSFTAFASTKQVLEANDIMMDFIDSHLRTVQVDNAISNFMSQISPANALIQSGQIKGP